MNLCLTVSTCIGLLHQSDNSKGPKETIREKEACGANTPIIPPLFFEKTTPSRCESGREDPRQVVPTSSRRADAHVGSHRCSNRCPSSETNRQQHGGQGGGNLCPVCAHPTTTHQRLVRKKTNGGNAGKPSRRPSWGRSMRKTHRITKGFRPVGSWGWRRGQR